MTNKTEKGWHARQSIASPTDSVFGNAAVALHYADLRRKHQATNAKPVLSTATRLRFKNDNLMPTMFEPCCHWMLKNNRCGNATKSLSGDKKVKKMTRKGKIKVQKFTISVSCTRWLHRQMLQNLSRAARSNIGRQLAKRAEVLLVAVEAPSRPASAAACSKSVTVTTLAQTVAPTTAVSMTSVSRIRWLATATLGQYIRRVSTFVKRNG